MLLKDYRGLVVRTDVSAGVRIRIRIRVGVPSANVHAD